MHNKIIIVIGPKRAGKTRKVSTMVEKLDRVATFDMMKDAQYLDHVEHDAVFRGKPAEFARYIGKDKKTFKVVYQPTIIKLQDNGLIDSPEFEPIVKLCHLRGDMYLIIDEAHLLCNSRNCPPELMMASYVGGHSGFSMILVAQSFTGIHPAVRRNADELLLWRIIEPSDLDGIRERCGDDVMRQVQTLRSVELDDDNEFVKSGQMLHWTKSKGVVEVTE
jgi:hypothetical protein